MAFFQKNLVTIGKERCFFVEAFKKFVTSTNVVDQVWNISQGQIRYWTVPETVTNLTKALNGRNVALKHRRNSSFNDMAVTENALFIAKGSTETTMLRTIFPFI